MNCCENFYNCLGRHKYNILAKGSILVSAMSSTFTLLDAFTGSYTILKYTSLALLNVGIVISGYAYSEVQKKADELGDELESVHEELRKQTIINYRFPTTPIETQTDILDFNEIYLRDANFSRAQPSEPIEFG